MWIRGLAVAIATATAVSCGATGTFVCDAHEDCAAGADAGTCEADGYCSFPDAACPSGRRYGSHAPGNIAGTCVPSDVADGGNTSITSVDDAEGGPLDTSITDASDTTLALDGSSSNATGESTGGPLDTSSGPTSASGESSTTGPNAFEVEYEAAIAVCTEETLFDPAHCAAGAGPDQITIDGANSGMLVSNAWLRFDLDDALAGAELLSAELTVTVGSDMDDGGPSSGELWSTEPFDLVSLMVGNPAALELIGADQGVVLVGGEITWSIPIELVIVGDSVHLGLLPVMTNGFDVWGDSSDLPPRLVVTAQ